MEVASREREIRTISWREHSPLPQERIVRMNRTLDYGDSAMVGGDFLLLLA